MTAHYAAPHRGGSAPVHENAALLIDFDNVTMGIRSDLTKELKNLLDSDIIRGKVAVQRAYADWRRYPQYIVPLSEGSVDLIFAPAYGPSSNTDAGRSARLSPKYSNVSASTLSAMANVPPPSVRRSCLVAPSSQPAAFPLGANWTMTP